jgi:hypothetical protein
MSVMTMVLVGALAGYQLSGIPLAFVSYRMTLAYFGDARLAKQFALMTLLAPASIWFELSFFKAPSHGREGTE